MTVATAKYSRNIVARCLRILDILSWHRMPITTLQLVEEYKEQYADESGLCDSAFYVTIALLEKEGWIEKEDRFGLPTQGRGRAPNQWRIGRIALKLVERIEIGE